MSFCKWLSILLVMIVIMKHDIKSSFYPLFFIIESNFHFWEVVFSVFLYLWQVHINVALNNITNMSQQTFIYFTHKKKKKSSI